MYILLDEVILTNKAYDALVEELVGSGITPSQLITEQLSVDNT